MGSVNTPATPTTRATSTQYHNISPHTTGRTRLRMGSVNTPATPTTRATSTQYHNLPSYDGTHPASYGVCQHADYSYDTCDLNTISQYLPSYDGTHPALYGVCQHASYSKDTCDLNTRPGYILTSFFLFTLGLATFSPACTGLKVLTQSQDGIYNDTYPASLVQIERSDRSRSHDRTVTKTLTLGLAFPEYPGLRFMIRRILYNPGNT
ncbi:unnamed protein product [Prunus brigantina]